MNAVVDRKVILLADDDADDAEMFGFVLAEIDSSVEFYHVKNGKAALEYLQDSKSPKPDIIFLDINMPGVNGWQTLQSLKKDVMARQIPVVIYSTSSHPRDRQIADELGAASFITKPSDFKLLRETLATTVRSLLQQIKLTR